MGRGLWTTRLMKDGPRTQKRIMSTMRSCLLRSLHYGSGNNGRCRVDMYAIQGGHEWSVYSRKRFSILGTVGTMRDMSFLIDFLPSFLYPTGRMPIVEWGVAGKSLGGHATWIALVMGKLSDPLKER